MRFRYADFGIRTGARFAGQLEREDPRHVRLECQHLQVKHQPRVVRVGGRYSDRAIQIAQRGVGRFGLGLLNTPLHLTDGIQILADFGAIRRAQLFWRREIPWLSESRRLVFFRSSESRSAEVPPSPKRRSKTMRG